MTDEGVPDLNRTDKPSAVIGPGCTDIAGKKARELGAQRVLIVTDPGLVAAGHADRLRVVLEQSELDVTIFDQTHENPTTRDVEAATTIAKDANIDFIVALGGGSAMDTAKGCNFLLTNGGKMADYWGHNKASKPMLPMIAIPTTAGTGSEVQSYALIADADTHQKMACGDSKALPRLALLDPELTVTQPPHVTASAGIDAVAHAVETAVTTKRTEASFHLSREAFDKTSGALRRVMSTPGDLEARGAMLHGAMQAGQAIELSMLGAAHSAANPLTAQFDIVHGQAVGIMLPHVVRFNAQAPATAAIYQQLAGCDAAQLASSLHELLGDIGLSRTLGNLGIPAGAIASLAEQAATQWTAQFNPRPLTVDDFVSLYQAAL